MLCSVNESILNQEHSYRALSCCPTYHHCSYITATVIAVIVVQAYGGDQG